MMTTLCSRREDIERFRGDTTPLVVELVDANCEPITETILGATFRLTVSQEEWPDTNAPLFEIGGTDLDDVAKSITFAFGADEADHVGAFHYDVEMIESGGIKHTALKGLMIFEQDITKSDETFEWTPPTGPSDGDPATVDGSLDWYAFANRAVVATYETRDARRVIRDGHVPTAAWQSTGWMGRGPDIPRHAFQMPGWEWQATLYMNLALLGMDFQEGAGYHYVWLILDNMTGTPNASGSGGTLHNSALGYLGMIAGFPYPNTGGWTDDDWFKIGFRVLADRTVEYQIKREADADNWLTIPSPYQWGPAVTPITMPVFWTRRVFPHNAASVIDLWKYEWRRLT